VLEVTGGGAIKHQKALENLYCDFSNDKNEIEMMALGINYENKNQNAYYWFDWSSSWCTPLKLKKEKTVVANIGTGTSISILSGDSMKRVTGTVIGGGTFQGLSNLLIKLSKSVKKEERFIKYLDKGLKGKKENMSLIVKDIFGTDSPFKHLDETIVVSSFSKTFETEDYSEEDISRNLAFMVGTSVSQVAVQVAKEHKIS